MTVYIACEGRSDKEGIRALLFSPALPFSASGIGIRISKFDSVQELFRKIGAYINRAVSTGKADAVFALVDLKGSQEYVSWPPEPEEVRKALMDRAAPSYRRQFHPHVAVHEIEAWVFADPNPLGQRLGTRAPTFGEPEKINFTSNPSDRLDDLYKKHRGHRYNKTTELPLLFEQTSVERVYRTCPNFKLFLEDLFRVSGLSNPF